MRRIEIGEQEHDRDRLDLAELPDLTRDGAGPGFVERRDHIAVLVDPFGDLEAVPALDQRLRLDPAHVVVRLAVAPLDEDHVAKALGGHVGDHRAFPLEHRVGRDRRAQTRVADRLGMGELLQAGKNPGDRIARHRKMLPDVDRLGLAVVGDEVGKRAPDVDPEHVPHPASPSSAHRAQACRYPCKLQLRPIERYRLTAGTPRRWT